ncbi:hypothetical protein XFF6992_220022 [Xanthomonas citri pv. fuscans]|nr:hypothetical protein XFF6992_220022 [Xanthomonas citri pv. fuscans]
MRCPHRLRDTEWIRPWTFLRVIHAAKGAAGSAQSRNAAVDLLHCPITSGNSDSNHGPV